MSFQPTSSSSAFPVLVILNPFSGLAAGQKTLTSTIIPALTSANVPYKVIETEKQAHAVSYFKTNIKQILVDLVQSLGVAEGGQPPADAHTPKLSIMIVGGDGTVHEVINGILQGLQEQGPGEQGSIISEQFRPKIQFSVIPTGTGNAISTSLGVASVADALGRFLKGDTVPLKIMSVSKQFAASSSSSDTVAAEESRNHDWQTVLYTSVVNSFGLHCATVYDAEGFRAMGNGRFKASAMKNIALLKQYKAALRFFGPVQQYDRDLKNLGQVSSPSKVAQESNSVATSFSTLPTLTLSGPFTYLMLTKQASLEPGFTPTPLATTSDDWIDVLAVQNVGRKEILNILGGATSGGQHLPHEHVEYFKVQQVEIETAEDGRLCLDGEFLEIAKGPEGRVRIELVQDANLQLFSVYV